MTPAVTAAKTPAEHREFVQATWREATDALNVAYLLKLHGGDATIEDLRKGVELANKVTGAEAEKKVDPNAGLSVFHFTFSDGGVTAVPVVQLADPNITDVQPKRSRKATPQAALANSPAETDEQARDMSLVDMMSGLDKMLGEAD